jgi:3-oxoacyl-[acyl-carrier-protein] synthase II
MPNRRVVITGLGTVNPSGTSPEATWSAVRAGIPAPRTTGIDTGLALPRVCEIDYSELPVRRKDMARMNRGDSLGVIAALKAALAAGWVADESADRGLFFGTAKDTTAKSDFLALIEPVSRQGYAAGAAAMVDNALHYLTPFALLDCMPNLALHYVSEIFRIRGDNCCFLQTGAAGTAAIAAAYRAVRSGRLRAALAGGFDCLLDRLNLARYASLGLLTSCKGRAARENEPACRPFDRRRDGFVPAEAGAVVALEDRDTALQRGARIHGEILGVGAACDASVYPWMTSGFATASALRAALDSARMEPNALGFIVANGTATVAADRAEAAGLSFVLGDLRSDIPVTAMKGVFGHVMAGAGALELIMALRALAAHEVPPVCGCEDPDESCPVHLVRERPLQRDSRAAALMSVGLGGQTCVLIVGRGELNA